MLTGVFLFIVISHKCREQRPFIDARPRNISRYTSSIMGQLVLGDHHLIFKERRWIRNHVVWTCSFSCIQRIEHRPGPKERAILWGLGNTSVFWGFSHPSIQLRLVTTDTPIKKFTTISPHARSFLRQLQEKTQDLGHMIAFDPQLPPPDVLKNA